MAKPFNPRIVLISDFNLENFAALARTDPAPPAIEVEVAPYGQVFQSLVQEDAEHWSAGPDGALVWTRPEGAIQSFGDFLQMQPGAADAVPAEVEAFAQTLLAASRRLKFLFVAGWVMVPGQRGLGMLDMQSPHGVARMLMRMNLLLAEKLGAAGNVYLLDAQRWLQAGGKKAFSPKHWFPAKIPYATDVFKEAVADIKAALLGLAGQAKKLIILDLDDTLWGGIVGEVGWEKLHLGGHDPIGESFVDFQKALKALARRGVLLSIASKNEEATALEAIETHPEMVLRKRDFAGWRINWGDKAQNIVDLVGELNLGLQSVVFIDDNPAERARIREALPEIMVPEWPRDKLAYTQALHALRCFDAPAISEEDRKRTLLYAAERERKSVRRSVGSIENWLASLEMIVRVETFNDANFERTLQLLNKTNQMNLTTRRLSEKELREWCGGQGRRLWTFRVGDKFGDAGLCGIASEEVAGGEARVVDFLLSCRVMGRRVEETMLWKLIRHAAGQGVDRVVLAYQPTAKNKPCLGFLERSDLERGPENEFYWDLARSFPVPRGIRIVEEPAGE